MIRLRTSPASPCCAADRRRNERLVGRHVPSRAAKRHDRVTLPGAAVAQHRPVQRRACDCRRGIPGQPNVYYFGATGGGVWKTDDAGVSWLPVSDGYFKTGSVGGIAVAPSAPDIVYAGMGEACVRSNFSEGDGVYKSTDAGRSWTSIGLTETKQIGRIAVHPANPDVVYVAALGNVFGPSRERGVFRSRDGGKTWRNVLFVNDEAGAADVAIDPHAPDTVYATFWHVRRKPWGLFSGGPGSGLYRSTDGGDTWTELTRGLPLGVKGRIGVAVSPVDGKRVWAIVEAHDGGVFRSDDAGSTWVRTSDEARLRERAWYYSHIFADTKERDTVYVLTLQIYKSSDGGKTFETIRPRHADNHDLWIAPDDNRRMINGNDGGANISVNGGRTWSSQDNQATAQFYRVTTDTRFPYVVYGAQQDNSTVAIPSRTERRWHRSHRLARRRRGRERMDRTGSARSEHRLRGQLLRPVDALRSSDGTHAKHLDLARVAGRAAARRTSITGSSGRSRSLRHRTIRARCTRRQTCCSSPRARAKPGRRSAPI